ncbi:MAG: nitronate monooxygenase [Porticoccaceae bacterium]|mgnify:FL=1|jgi:nitronate monooxygenase|nr:nitronate monooxygenase [Porticoccaceae bacterium]MDA7753063.1 nitronate monooxygenase [bacterium]MBT7258969.1 nitronate monooxygenase [Porticoccaceae bacterium]MDA8734532.1 nitronate monooxygenase [Porticoccaceae bacterium]MDA9574642.1 nitronate monooxygenase [Porticoccaceae bacterium]
MSLSELRLPVIQAPLFLLSGPEMVIASCRAGIVGSFPSPNARTPEILEDWLIEITSALKGTSRVAPWAINLVMHRSNPRRHADLELAVKYQAPLVITALGSPEEAVEAVHGYGGKIYADVNSVEFARRAAATGVDGLALICAGAGGHTGQISPFAFVEEVRQFFDGEIILSGAVSNGRAIYAAEVLGADYVYMGTRFIPSHECLAADDYKQMVVDASAGDIVTSDSVTGVKANWLKNSLLNAGYDLKNMPPAGDINFLEAAGDVKRWRDIWAAGQAVGSITQQQSIKDIVDQLEQEYLSVKGVES